MSDIARNNLISDFIRLSNFAGVRPDLVQAGGGNSSVKLDENVMLVKASGRTLSEVDKNYGYVEINFPIMTEGLLELKNLSSKTKQDLDEHGERLVNHSTVSGQKGRASIEVFLHAYLRRFVLHTHPVAVNTILCRGNWKSKVLEMFPDALVLGYYTPGIELGLSLQDKVSKFNKPPKIIFLQSHGLVVNCDTVDETLQITEEVTIEFEKLTGLDFSAFRKVTKLNELLGTNLSVKICQDSDILELFSKIQNFSKLEPLFPDFAVYCGARPLVAKFDNIEKALRNYVKRFNNYPRVIKLEEDVFFVASNLQKATQVEEIFRAQLQIVFGSTEPCEVLSKDEVNYLLSWEAEKYRANL